MARPSPPWARPTCGAVARAALAAYYAGPSHPDGGGLSGSGDLGVVGDVLYETAFALDYQVAAIDALVAAVEDGLADPVKQAERRLTRPA